MKRILLLAFIAIQSIVCVGQTAPDFNATTSDGRIVNLYDSLDAGKTVILDFFYISCQSCYYWAPVVEQAYQNHGAGNGSVQIWGINGGVYSNDSSVNAYMQHYGITNPCISGLEGNGRYIDSIYRIAFSLVGYPVYALICPDKKIFWEVNFPPTVTGFDSLISICEAVSSIDNISLSDVKIFPNPADNNISISSPDKEFSSIEIKNLLGETVFARPFNNHEIIISTKELKEGIYFVKTSFPHQEPLIKKIQILH